MKRPRLLLLGICIVTLFSLAANANENIEDMISNGLGGQEVSDLLAYSEQQCLDATFTMVISQGDMCIGYRCDGQSYSMVSCDQTTCICYQDGIRIKSFPYTACDSSILFPNCDDGSTS
jgi:hypothetical protein